MHIVGYSVLYLMLYLFIPCNAISPAQVGSLIQQSKNALDAQNFDQVQDIINQLYANKQTASAKDLEIKLLTAQRQAETDKLNIELKQKEFEGSEGQTLRKLRLAEKEISGLKDQIDALQKGDTKAAQEAALRITQQNFDSQLKQLQAKNDGLAKQLVDTKQAYEKEKTSILELRKSTGEDLANLDAAKVRIEQLQNELAERKAASEQIVVLLNEKHQKEIAELKQGNITSLAKQLEESERLRLADKTEFTKVQKENGDLIIELKSLRSKLADFERAKLVWEKQMNDAQAAQAKAISDATKSLQDKITQLEAQSTKAKADQEVAIKGTTEKLKAEKEKALEDLGNTKGELEQQKIVVKNKNVEIEKLKKQVEGLRANEELLLKARAAVLKFTSKATENNPFVIKTYDKNFQPIYTRDYGLFEQVINLIGMGSKDTIDEIINKAIETRKQAGTKTELIRYQSPAEEAIQENPPKRTVVFPPASKPISTPYLNPVNLERALKRDKPK
jgi:hypothetical protein